MASDPRAAQARMLHLASKAAEADAAQKRGARDDLIRILRREGWTYAALAKAIGCSPELIAHVSRR